MLEKIGLWILRNILQRLMTYFYKIFSYNSAVKEAAEINKENRENLENAKTPDEIDQSAVDLANHLSGKPRVRKPKATDTPIG